MNTIIITISIIAGIILLVGTISVKREAERKERINKNHRDAIKRNLKLTDNG